MNFPISPNVHVRRLIWTATWTTLHGPHQVSKWSVKLGRLEDCDLRSWFVSVHVQTIVCKTSFLLIVKKFCVCCVLAIFCNTATLWEDSNVKASSNYSRFEVGICEIWMKDETSTSWGNQVELVKGWHTCSKTNLNFSHQPRMRV